MEELRLSSSCPSAPCTLRPMVLTEAFHKSDMEDALSASRGISSPAEESRISTSWSHPLSPPFEYQIDDTNTLEEGTEIEEELYKFYEGLSEKAFDLSMTDLVVLKPVCATDGLPVEDNRAQKGASCAEQERGEVTCRIKQKLSSWLSFPQKPSPNPSPDRISSQESIVLLTSQVPQLCVSKSFHPRETSRSKVSALESSAAFVRSLSSKSHRKQSARISPKISPICSPHSSSASAMFPNGFKVMAPRNGVSPHAHQKNPGIKMDANNQCTVCSSYTHFFKSRCEVCGRTYCSYCMKEALIHTPNGTRCRGVCAERLSRRSMKKSAISCWPFGSKNFPVDDL